MHGNFSFRNVGGTKKTVEEYSKEELLERIPDLWQDFWVSFDNVGAIAEATARREAWDVAQDAACDAAGAAMMYAVDEAAGDIAFDVTFSAVCDVMMDPSLLFVSLITGVDTTTFARNTAWVSAWKPGGIAYNMVKDKNRSYFENLVRVLEEQISISKKIINQGRYIFK